MFSFLKKSVNVTEPKSKNQTLHITTAQAIFDKIKQHADAQTAQKQSAFHKTNDPESKDIFLGVSKTICKQIAKEHATDATLDDISKLLKTQNNEHEIKLTAIFLLIEKIKQPQQSTQLAKKAYDFYFQHLAQLTSWDIIDESAPVIIGEYLQKNPHYPRDDLYRLIKSRSDWDKRIALISTQTFIDNNDFADAFELVQMCFNELSPTVLKTAGKVLKHIGKQNKSALIEFIAQNQTKIPREMLNAAMGNLPATLKKTIRTQTKILNKK